MLLPLLSIAAGYLIGAIPFGYLIARSRGVDIFQHGSGNIGATNVGRVLGRRFGLLVFGLDFAKGAMPVALAQTLGAWTEVATGLAAFLGHLFPIWLGFRGGKGVATGAGIVALMLPGPALAGLSAWLVCVMSFRYVSLASVVAVLVLGAVQVLQAPDVQEPRTLFCLLAAALVILRHRSNLVRLAQGRENQLQERPVMLQLRRSLHVLALGLWFGSAVFFSFVVGLSLFHTFENVAAVTKRPAWLPLSPAFSKVDEHINGPKEQGSRLAGAAVGPMFDYYFALQGACGLIALATALPGARAGGVHRWRVWLLFLALVLVLVGWPVERRVSALRGPRNFAIEVYLQAPPERADVVLADMRAARGEFGRWHAYSLMLNLAAIVCVTGAMALAGNLPPSANPQAVKDA